MNKILILIVSILLIPTIILLVPTIFALCTSDNNFGTPSNTSVICGYCYTNESNYACNISTNCYLDISYINNTFIYQQQLMNSSGDGSYNITLDFSNLTDGNYRGNMWCNEYQDIFNIKIGTTPLSGVGTGGTGTQYSPEELIKQNITEEVKTNDRLAKDIDSSFNRLVNRWFPSNKQLGMFIILFVILIILFYKEALLLFNKLEFKYKSRRNK